MLRVSLSYRSLDPFTGISYCIPVKYVIDEWLKQKEYMSKVYETFIINNRFTYQKHIFRAYLFYCMQCLY